MSQNFFSCILEILLVSKILRVRYSSKLQTLISRTLSPSECANFNFEPLYKAIQKNPCGAHLAPPPSESPRSMFPIFWQHCHILVHVFFLAFTFTLFAFWAHILSSNLPVPASWLHTYFLWPPPHTHTYWLCMHCRVSVGSTASRIWADRILWSALINATQLQMALLPELDWCIGVGPVAWVLNLQALFFQNG